MNTKYSGRDENVLITPQYPLELSLLLRSSPCDSRFVSVTNFLCSYCLFFSVCSAVLSITPAAAFLPSFYPPVFSLWQTVVAFDFYCASKRIRSSFNPTPTPTHALLYALCLGPTHTFRSFYVCPYSLRLCCLVLYHVCLPLALHNDDTYYELNEFRPNTW